MSLTEYIVLFAFVALLGAGLPGPGDASLIAAGTLAGEGKLHVGIVLATAMVAWMLGSVAGYEIGIWKGRWLLDHPGRLETSRRKMLLKGDHAFGGHRTFVAAAIMPAFVSGIFRVRWTIFLLAALTAGIGWVGMYVGLSYFLGAEIAHHIASAGTKAIIGVIVLVIIGLGIRFGWSRWHGGQQGQSALASARRKRGRQAIAEGQAGATLVCGDDGRLRYRSRNRP
jgi:membrane protein DedA with SNARE-associated domain